MNQTKTVEILRKPYSKGVVGYILRIADFLYIVINSCLSKREAEKAESALKELSTSNPHNKLTVLKSNGEVCKTDDLNFLERAC